jgi:hypothetical protein
MNAEISAKFAAFTASLTMTGMIIAGVAYMFAVPVAERTARIADSGQPQQCGCTPGRADYCRCEAMPGL